MRLAVRIDGVHRAQLQCLKQVYKAPPLVRREVAGDRRSDQPLVNRREEGAELRVGIDDRELCIDSNKARGRPRDDLCQVAFRRKALHQHRDRIPVRGEDPDGEQDRRDADYGRHDGVEGTSQKREDETGDRSDDDGRQREGELPKVHGRGPDPHPCL
jgi:hypothetical protein